MPEEASIQVNEEAGDDELSLFEVASTLLRNRWRILRWMLFGGLLAVIPVLRQRPTYTAVGSFIPQGAESGSSGIRNLAGQFGVSLGANNQGHSPEFYENLIRSRVILQSVVDDTVTITEQGGRRATVAELFGGSGDSRQLRLQTAAAQLAPAIQTSISLTTSVLTFGVTTPWPSVSASIGNKLIDEVNAFNLRTRQSQASEERRFTEGRLIEARTALRLAEDRLQGFLQSNRQIGNSPELAFQRDRLEREVAFNQEIVTSLAQSYEEVRVRAVRDTPVITVIERPALPTQPNSRQRARRVLFGVFLGGLLAVVFSFLSETMHRRRLARDPNAELFFKDLGEIRRGLSRFPLGRKNK